MSEQIFFILANPRSGSTLLRLLLTSHSRVCVPPECGFMVWLFDKYKFFNFNEKTIISFIYDLKNVKKIELWKIDLDLLKVFLFEKKPNSYSSLCYFVYLFYSLNNYKNNTLIGDKNNFYIYHLDTLLKLFPKAKFIHILRNPFKIFNSYKKINSTNNNQIYKPLLASDPFNFANEWVKNIKSITSFGARLTKNFFLEVNYEDIAHQDKNIRNGVIKKITNFLEVCYEESMFNYAFNNLNNEPFDFFWKSNNRLSIDEYNKLNQISLLSDEDISCIKAILKKENVNEEIVKILCRYKELG